MNTLSSLLLIVGVVVVPAARGRACDAELVPNIDISTVPVDGAVDVPQNVTPFVNLYTFGTAPPRLVTTVDGVDVDVDVAIFDHIIDGPFLRQLVPTAPLSAGQYRIVGDDGDVATFEVGNSSDNEAPAAPVLTSDVTLTATDPDSTGFECAYRGTGVFTVDAEAGTLLVAARDTVGNTLRDRSLLAATTDRTITVESFSAEQAHVVAIDAAGNISGELVVDVAIPQGGCAQAPATLLPGLWALLAGVRRRRRG